IARALCVRLERAVPVVARSRPCARAARRGTARRVLQERRVLRDVRAQVLLDAHHPGDRAEGGAPGAAAADTRGHTGRLTDLCHILRHDGPRKAGPSVLSLAVSLCCALAVTPPERQTPAPESSPSPALSRAPRKTGTGRRAAPAGRTGAPRSGCRRRAAACARGARRRPRRRC